MCFTPASQVSLEANRRVIISGCPPYPHCPASSPPPPPPPPAYSPPDCLRMSLASSSRFGIGIKSDICWMEPGLGLEPIFSLQPQDSEL